MIGKIGQTAECCMTNYINKITVVERVHTNTARQTKEENVVCQKLKTDEKNVEVNKVM